MTLTEVDQFEVRSRDALAVGVPTDQGFLVRAGGVARKQIAPSGIQSVTSLRRPLLETGVLIDEGETLRFAADHVFGSPSAAAAAVLGRTANGWTEWKRKDGATLSEVKRVKRAAGALLSPQQRSAILAQHELATANGSLRPPSVNAQEEASFRARFSPAVLSGVDGEALLTLMHDTNNRDSLVYWLEFKSDDEFHTKEFGSIAGGSALKFRIFRRRETGLWQAALESKTPHDISIEQAIEIAKSHREQLRSGCDLLEALPADATDEDYAELQDQMDEVAPDVSRLAWGHKYFRLMYPEKIDGFHNPDWHRFHLLKLLQLPPEGDGRYICAGRFVAGARETGLTVPTFANLLNLMHGDRHLYWRVGTRGGPDGVSHWQMMTERNCVAIGWPKLGELSWVESTKDSRKKLKSLLAKHYPKAGNAVGSDAAQITHFIASMAENDVVLAADGSTILGIGVVTGDYRYEPSLDFPHQRPVRWIEVAEWKLPVNEALRTSVREIRLHSENILETERRIQSAGTINADGGGNADEDVIVPPLLTGVPARIQSILDRKSQIILYGPPGCGKTYWAESAARDLAAISAFGKLFANLDEKSQLAITGDNGQPGLVRMCCFHPAYGYEDFLEGYRPHTLNGQISFQLRPGIFKRLCEDAAAAPGKCFYLIIDEINRGDIPRIFGELLTTLEKDKRGKRIILPVSQESFVVPPNVYLIGTMNTADRSISLLDAALRRRFGFLELMPDSKVLHGSSLSGIPLRAWFEALNTRIRTHVGRDARNLQIGHSYLLHMGTPIKDIAALRRTIRDDIVPLLEEYCYEDYSALCSILGEQLVDAAQQRIRYELFDEGKEMDLVQALLAPCPEISTSTLAITAEDTEASEDEAEADDEAADDA